MSDRRLLRAASLVVSGILVGLGIALSGWLS